MAKNIIPANIEMEQTVLNCVMNNPMSIAEIAFLKPEHFYREAHQAIYTILFSFYEHSKAINTLSILDELEKTDKQEAIEALTEINFVQPYNRYDIADYAKIVLRKWTLRQLIKTSGEIAGRAYQEDDDALAYAEKALQDISKGIETKALSIGSEAINRLMTKIMEIRESNPNGKPTLPGIPTGFPYLNAIIGGFQKEKLYVVAGSPGQGKTALCFNFIDTAIRHGSNVLFFSLEMGEEELMTRWASMRAKVDSRKLSDNSFDKIEADALYDAWDELQKHGKQLIIDDTSGNNTIAMRSRAIQANAEHGIDMIVMDYIGIATVPHEERKFFSEKRLEVEEVVNCMKNLARELKIPVIALSQLNRASTKQERPTMQNLAESAAVERNANVVMLIHKDSEAIDGASEYNVNLIIDKNRSGSAATVPLRFVGKHTMFYAIKSESRDE